MYPSHALRGCQFNNAFSRREIEFSHIIVGAAEGKYAALHVVVRGFDRCETKDEVGEEVPFLDGCEVGGNRLRRAWRAVYCCPGHFGCEVFLCVCRNFVLDGFLRYFTVTKLEKGFWMFFVIVCQRTEDSTKT